MGHQLPHFDFHGELLEIRAAVIEHLAEQDIAWLSHYGPIDLRHDIYGFEVTAIHDESVAHHVEELLRRFLPAWPYVKTYYEDHNVREIGWKVVISRRDERVCDAIREAGQQGVAAFLKKTFVDSIKNNFPTFTGWFSGRDRS